MTNFLKEPLLHFLLIGTLLFLIYGIANPAPVENEILVDDNLINELVAKWELQRNRQPTLEELVGLVGQHVEQEVLYQEALVMNLDHNDEMVKRRLAQKMEFISDAMVEELQPSEETLLNFYNENKAVYKKPSVYSLQHVYYSTDDRPDAESDAIQALKNGATEGAGDQIALPSQYVKASTLILRGIMARCSPKTWRLFRPTNGWGQSNRLMGCIWFT